MPELEILKKLIKEANVRKDVLARLCNCTPASIQNYIQGRSIPSGTKLLSIREGLKNYKALINSIIEE